MATAALLGLIYPGHGVETSLRTDHVERMTFQDYIKVMSVSATSLRHTLFHISRGCESEIASLYAPWCGPGAGRYHATAGRVCVMASSPIVVVWESNVEYLSAGCGLADCSTTESQENLDMIMAIICVFHAEAAVLCMDQYTALHRLKLMSKL